MLQTCTNLVYNLFVIVQGLVLLECVSGTNPFSDVYSPIELIQTIEDMCEGTGGEEGGSLVPSNFPLTQVSEPRARRRVARETWGVERMEWEPRSAKRENNGGGR